MNMLKGRKSTTGKLTKGEVKLLHDEVIPAVWKRAMLDSSDYPTPEQIVRVTREAKLLSLYPWLKLNRPDYISNPRLLKILPVIIPPDRPNIITISKFDNGARETQLPILNLE